jgi:beta-glucanase (GH16 family)
VTLSAVAGSLHAFAVATAAPPVTPGVTWRLDEDFSDEFNGASLDRFKWDTRYRNWSGRDPGMFDPANVSVGDGFLRLDVRWQPPGTLPPGKSYTAATVNTTGGDPDSKQRDFLYGYIEIRAKGMDARTTSAFWLHKNTPDYWTEIDVMELARSGPRTVPTSLHVIREAGVEVVPGGSLRYSQPLNFDDAQVPNGQTYFNSFHTYAVNWNENTIDFYVDGALLRSHPNDRWHHPLSLNFTNSLQEWNGLPTASQLESTQPMLVDYVRVYRTGPGNEHDHSGFEYQGAAGMEDAASWTENPWMQRTSADARSGGWSLRLDNSIANASGSSQWKKLQPTQNGYEVSPGTPVMQQIWVNKTEGFPNDTAKQFELVLRWNGLSTGATTASFDVANLTLDEWKLLHQATLVPALDAIGNPVRFVDVLYVINNQSESAHMDGTLLVDDAFFGKGPQVEQQELSGDYNRDGRVDAADYVVWRHVNTSNNDAGADGEHILAFDEAGFNLWKSNFGQRAQSNVQVVIDAVPEPATLYLAPVVVLAVARCVTTTRRYSVIPSWPAF